MTFFSPKARLLLFALPSAVHPQGYLKSPKSRNYFAHTDGAPFGGDENTPYPEHAPSGLNVGGTAARCGIVENRNYDDPKNVFGLPLPFQRQACYQQGHFVDLEVHLTANKGGHFVYKACPIEPEGVATQECFDENPLTFVEDVSPNAITAPKHPHPEYSDRAYIQPPPATHTRFIHRFRLPENLVGERVLIQWHYVTADSCYMDEGYNSYPFPDGWGPRNIPMCDSITSDGATNNPEQFWNCAEVEISQECTDVDSITPPAGSGVTYNANHGEDSRLIAYVGNWEACPTEAQIDAYSHIVIAFAVSYTFGTDKNNCDRACTITAPPTCNGEVQRDLINQWRARGKKVILGFGGAGMGGSWSGDQNNCWDYCFGKEDRVAEDLVGIIDDQNLDGIDIEYEYCYDIAGNQAGKCTERTKLYTDEKAHTFLGLVTSMLRIKLDTLQERNNNQRRYEVIHAPMDSDLTSTSAYFQILKDRHADLDFIMPQFYNGETRAHADGLEDSGVGTLSAASMFASLSNDLFDSEPWKVVFGFCIDCTDTGSNVNGDEAVEIMSGLKRIDNGEFVCNGGASFWLASDDQDGVWSDAVMGEVSKSAGCSTGATTSSSTRMVTPDVGTNNDRAPALRGTAPGGTELVVDTQKRCGASEAVARLTCAEVCNNNKDCPSGEFCWGVFENYCGSLEMNYSGSPDLDNTSRCGTSELDARGLCKNTCVTDANCNTANGERCWRVHENYCGSLE